MISKKICLLIIPYALVSMLSSSDINMSWTTVAGAAELELNNTTDIKPANNLPYKYYGHLLSKKFHLPSCPFAKAISHHHLVLFHYRKEATDAHFSPCRYCLPAVWLSTHAAILNIHNSKSLPLEKSPFRRLPTFTYKLEHRI